MENNNNNQSSTQTVERKDAVIARLGELRAKNEKANYITTKSGKTLRDRKLEDFEKKYADELDEIAGDYRDINKVLYKNEVADNESPIIDEAKNEILEAYLGIEEVPEDGDRIERQLYFKGIKAMFKALRTGAIADLEKELREIEKKENKA